MGGICDGRVVIITGAGRGLGREHALAFAAEGAKVVVNDLGGADGPAGEVVAEIEAAGGEAMAHGADVSSWDEVGEMVNATIERFGHLDVAVNNAGNLRDRMFVKMSVEDWDSVMAVHLRGHFNLARHAVEHWRARAKAGEETHARIINTSSASGLQGSIGQSNYAAAKAGIAALTLVQAAELRRYGITSNAIAPVARTRMTEELFGEMMKKPDDGFDGMHPGNVSPLVVWLASDESDDITGQVFEVAADWIRISEGWNDGPEAKNPEGGRWNPADVGEGVREIVAKRTPAKKVYGT